MVLKSRRNILNTYLHLFKSARRTQLAGLIFMLVDTLQELMFAVLPKVSVPQRSAERRISKLNAQRMRNVFKE